MQQSQLLIGLQGVVNAPVQQIRRQGIRPGLAHHSGLGPESRQLAQKTVAIKVVANEGHKKITALKRAAVGADEAERNRLRALGVLIKPPGAGLLIRTEAEGISEELLIDDLDALLRQWEAIQQAAETSVPPVLLNRDEDFIHRILRDHMGPDLARVVVDDPAAVARVGSFLGSEHGNVVVESHDESTELLEHYKINAAIRDALRPRVDLPSGGYVIIEPTEALTVIDVNSGSFTRSNARETVLWTNVEAAIEIARQLKLRNIGGVIIIDFIDMDSRRDQLQLLEHFTTATRDDSARPQIAQLTELGLVELTRKRQGQNIYELFARACPSCGGLGHVAVLPGKDLS